MFDTEFYPSNEEAFRVLMRPFTITTRRGSYVSLKDKVILEPSAGNGFLIDRMIEAHNVQPSQIYCIEKDPDLRLILNGKMRKVIGDDFLEFSPDDYRFDAIIMNPPFSNGDEHLMRAWDILEYGGTVSCLLNEETIKNPYSSLRRSLIQLIEIFGDVTHVGQIFLNSDRPTAVRVSHVVLTKPKREEHYRINATETDEPIQDSNYSENPLAVMNVVQSLVAQYNHAQIGIW